jgi:hypothetical protein
MSTIAETTNTNVVSLAEGAARTGLVADAPAFEVWLSRYAPEALREDGLVDLTTLVDASHEALPSVEVVELGVL